MNACLKNLNMVYKAYGHSFILTFERQKEHHSWCQTALQLLYSALCGAIRIDQDFPHQKPPFTKTLPFAKCCLVHSITKEMGNIFFVQKYHWHYKAHNNIAVSWCYCFCILQILSICWCLREIWTKITQS